jgi:hypothetical protein
MVFKTREGLYKYLIMLFRLINTLTTFQLVINYALNNYLDIFVMVYLNNILVYTSGILEEYK